MAPNTNSLDAQTTKERQLMSSVQSAYASSKCAALYTTSGIATKPSGATLSDVSDFYMKVSGASPGDIVASASGTFGAIAIANLAGEPFHADSLDVSYADGSNLSIPFGSTAGIYKSIMSLNSGFALVVDIDAKPISGIRLVNPTNDVADCQPAGASGPTGGLSACKTSIEIRGLTKGNGLAP